MSYVREFYLKLAIVVRMPMAFEQFCDKIFMLKTKQLSTSGNQSQEERKINVIFEIYNSKNEKVATFAPSGNFQCLEKSFEPTFSKIVEDLNYAVSKAAITQKERADRLDKKWTKDFGLEK